MKTYEQYSCMLFVYADLNADVYVPWQFCKTNKHVYLYSLILVIQYIKCNIFWGVKITILICKKAGLL